ncbi:MAG: rRNA ((1498)-N(3))-methyltransferase [Thermoleophilia bacterium]|nr:rRNA ((1498)-N(3))-methyltransferase [Thermoleophilia bacterium]
MADGDPHRFRFFTTNVGMAGTRVELSSADAAHLAVLRLATGDSVEIVDAAAVVWEGAIAAGGLVTLRAPLPIEAPRVLPRIDLIAGALVGGRFDELVDGAVQAGASSIVPFASRTKDAARLEQRHERLQRVALAAAKQAKRTDVPQIAAPIDREDVLARVPGIVLDAGAADTLETVLLAGRAAGDAVVSGWTVLVGPAEGLAPTFVAQLLDAGWRGARLGPTVLRSELAAAVSVAMISMHAAR